MPKDSVFEMNGLEERVLFSWNQFAINMRQDVAAAAYPQINGKGITVAVIDDGVDYNHPALQGKVIGGWNYWQNNGNFGITPGTEPHGTGVASVIAAKGFTNQGVYAQGIATGANLISLKQHSNTGVKAAMDWVIANKYKYNIQAISMIDFIGSGPWKSIYSGEMQTLANMGVVIFSASGNQGAYVPIENPGLDPNDYVVSGVNKFDQFYATAQRNGAVDLLGPADDVSIAYNNWNGSPMYTNFADGTSWSAPFAAGTAALIKQINSNFSPAQVVQIMKDSGKKIYDPASRLTYSRIDVYGAITLALQRSGQAGKVTNPVTPVSPPASPPASPPTVTYSTTTIQAENYDVGNDGYAYHDTDAANTGGQYKVGGVDIGATADAGGGYAVGWTHKGEWINYSPVVAATGTYTLNFRMSAVAAGASFHVNIDGKNVTGTMAVPATGDWNKYVTLSKAVGSISAGRHTFQIVWDSNQGNGFAANFNWWQLVKTA